MPSTWGAPGSTTPLGFGLVDVSAAAGEACDASPGGGEDQIFAVVGDYGDGSVAEGEVASLIDSYAPHFMVTTGDNYYENFGPNYITNVGAFYGDYIGGVKNRFFPSPGNTEYTEPSGGIYEYLDYFDLPGPGTRRPTRPAASCTSTSSKAPSTSSCSTPRGSSTTRQTRPPRSSGCRPS